MKIHYLIAGLVLPVFTAGAQVVQITDADLTTGTYYWTKDNIYELDGMVYLESGGVLNIEAGTVIKGLSVPNTNDDNSALIITRGATINATGTASAPIIFTSDLDDTDITNDLTHDDRALWGGIIILGNGIVGNGSGTGQVEGIPSNEPRGSYGGNNNAESSGVLRYVSIRHGGAVIGANNEINGLTLAGVGSGTQIEFIEVFANEDDGIEFFGGAASVKYALVAFCGDDSYDWDEGWKGKGQFWFALNSSTIGDCGFEGDGANPASATPVADPQLYNITLIGAGASGATAVNSHGMLLRDNTNATIANSIITDFANKAIQVQDAGGSSADSYSRIGDNPGINLLNNIWYAIGSNSTLDGSATGIIQPTSGGDDASASTLTGHMNNNGNQLTNPSLAGISRTANGGLDPRPMASAVTSNLAAYPADAFFSPVPYKGAFNPENTDWVKNWPALWSYGYFSAKLSADIVDQPAYQIELYPNPASGKASVSLHAANAGFLQVRLSDLSGRMLIQAYAGTTEAGQVTVPLNLEGLATGTYFCIITLNGETVTKKLIVH